MVFKTIFTGTMLTAFLAGAAVLSLNRYGGQGETKKTAACELAYNRDLSAPETIPQLPNFTYRAQIWELRNPCNTNTAGYTVAAQSATLNGNAVKGIGLTEQKTPFSGGRASIVSVGTVLSCDGRLGPGKYRVYFDIIDANGKAIPTPKGWTRLYTEFTIAAPAPNTAPSISVSNPGWSPYSYISANNVFRITGDVFDKESNISSLTVNGSGLSYSGYAFSHTVNLSVGANTYNFVVTDAKGLSASKSITINYSTPNAAPVLIIFNPTETVSSPSYTFSGRVSDPDGLGDLSSLKIGGSPIAWDAAGYFSKTVSLVPGPNSFNFIVTDKAGLSSSATGLIIYNAPVINAAPTLVFSTPTTTTITVASSVFTVIGKVNDPNGIPDLDFLQVGSSAIPFDAAGNFTKTLTLMPGTSDYTFRVVDRNGLSAQQTLRFIYTLPNSSPVLVINPIPSQTVSVPNINVSGRISDPDGMADIISFTDGFKAVPYDPVTGTFSINEALVPGTNRFVFTVTDKAGLQFSNTVIITYNVPVSTTTFQNDPCSYCSKPGFVMTIPVLNDCAKVKAMSPAELVYYSAKENGINPILLLAKLQDEQGLVQISGITDDEIRRSLYAATGYGVNLLDPAKKNQGFYPQIVSLTYQFNDYKKKGMTMTNAYFTYTQIPLAGSPFEGKYKEYSVKMNTLAGKSYSTDPSLFSAYTDFSDVSIVQIQSLLDTYAGPLKNKALFSATGIGTCTIPAVAAECVRLPFVSGQSFVCTQAHGGSTSHTGTAQYAYDFALARGTVVSAMRSGGTVRRKEESFGEGCSSSACSNNVNYVVVSYPDGTEDLYLHLDRNSVVVEVGDPIVEGQMLGRSGNSGWSTGPHLHVQRQTSSGASWWLQSIPFSFSELAGAAIVVGRSYTAGSCAIGGAISMPNLSVSKILPVSKCEGQPINFDAELKNTGTVDVDFAATPAKLVSVLTDAAGTVLSQSSQDINKGVLVSGAAMKLPVTLATPATGQLSVELVFEDMTLSDNKETALVEIKKAPAIPLITAAKVVFSSGETASFEVSNPVSGATYNWALGTGATLLSGAGTAKVQIAFGAAFTGTVEIKATADLVGCTSQAAMNATVINPNVFTFVLKDSQGAKGSIVSVPITARNFKNISGLQGTVFFDPVKSKYIGVSALNKDLPLSIKNFGLVNIAVGQLRVVWNDPFGDKTLPDDAVLFNLDLELIGTPGQQFKVGFQDLPLKTKIIDTSLKSLPFAVVQSTVTILDKVKISGLVSTPLGLPVKSAIVGLSDGQSFTTAADGTYLFTADAGKAVVVTPKKEINMLNGLSISAITAIQANALGTLEFTTAHQYISADVTGDFSADIEDIVSIQAALLNDDFSGFKRPSWQFVPKSQVLNVSNWQGYKTMSDLGIVSKDAPNVDFVGIKTGVVMFGDEDPLLRRVTVMPSFKIIKTSGSKVIVGLTLDKDASLQALAGTVSWDPKALRFESLEKSAVDLGKGINLRDKAKGILRLAAYSEGLKGWETKAGQAFVILSFEVLDATGNTEVVFGSQKTQAEIVTGKGKAMRTENLAETSTRLGVVQPSMSVFPNPISDFVSFESESFKEGQTLKVVFVGNNGLVLMEKTARVEHQKITLENLQTLPNSSLFYRITGEGIAVSGHLLKE